MELMNIENKFRVWLDFCDGLNLVKVTANTYDSEQRLAFMGVLSGKQQIANLLRVAGGNRRIMGGDTSLPVACETAPEKFASELEEGFRTESEMPLRFLNGEQLTEEEKSFRMPLSVSVFSSSTTVKDGFERVSNWFKRQGHNPTA